MHQRFPMLLCLLLFCGLISCGNTGDLYLPDETTSSQNAESK
ncbi:MAG: LPS translocon maturation chaperone LptM [Porticoccaceae bacterium]